MTVTDRCHAVTRQGRRCRNRAVDHGLCAVHADAPPGAGNTAGGDSMWDDGPARDGDASGLADLAAAFAAAVEEGWLDDLRDAAGFLRRRLSGDYDVDAYGFDAELTLNVLAPLVRPLHRHWWRVDSRGSDNLPPGAGLVVANHAGTLPADAVVMRLDILDRTGRHVRELGTDLVFRTPFLGHLARKAGVTMASGADADRLLSAGDLVVVWPEGHKGLAKPWKERYTVQGFGRAEFLATALRAGAPIVPTAIVGSEEIYPLVADVKPLARWLDLPYLPVVAQTLLLPVLGPLAALPLPSKWIIEYGEPLDTSAYGPTAADDPMAVFDLADQLRERIQRMLDNNRGDRRTVFG